MTNILPLWTFHQSLLTQNLLEEERIARLQQFAQSKDCLSVDEQAYLRRCTPSSLDRHIEHIKIEHEHRFDAIAVADANVTPDTIAYLRNRNIGIVDAKKTAERDEADEIIYRIVCRQEIIFITHDLDFLDHIRFDPARSPGVFILPTPKGRGVPHTPAKSLPLRNALDYFVEIAPQGPEFWRQTFHECGLDGSLRCYSPPFVTNRFNGSRGLATVYYSPRDIKMLDRATPHPLLCLARR